MANKRVIVNYSDLPPMVEEALNVKYPDGFENHVMKIDLGPSKQFYAVTVDYNDVSYLVKVNVSVDANIDDFDDEYIEERSDENDSNIITGLDHEPSTEDEDVFS